MKKDYRFTLRVDEHSMRKFDYVCQLYNLTSSYVLREIIRYVARHGHTKKPPSQDDKIIDYIMNTILSRDNGGIGM